LKPIWKREAAQARPAVETFDQPSKFWRCWWARPGEVVSREVLRERLWPSDTFVDFDHGLNNAVMRLREVLGDSSDHPRFIETLRGGVSVIAAGRVESPALDNVALEALRATSRLQFLKSYEKWFGSSDALLKADQGQASRRFSLPGLGCWLPQCLRGAR